jgi:hypothetical protein
MPSKNLVVFEHKASLREDLMTILREYPRPLQLRDVDGELYQRCHLMPGNELWSTLELYSMWQDGIVYQIVDHTGGVDYEEGYVLVGRLPEEDLEFSRRQSPPETVLGALEIVLREVVVRDREALGALRDIALVVRMTAQDC